MSKQLRFWRRSIYKHWWIIVLMAVLIGAIAAFVAYSLTPIYSATSTLLIEPIKSKVVSIDEIYGGPSGTREHLQTQVEIMKSRELASKLVKSLKLGSHPAMDPLTAPEALSISIPWKKWLPAALQPEAPATPPSAEALTNIAISKVMSNLSVQPVRNSQLIRVSFESPDRELAAVVANEIARVYIENDLEGRLRMTQNAASWLSERVKGLRQSVEGSERALMEYRDREKIVDAKGIALGASSQLTSMTTNLVTAQQKVAELESSYRQVQAVLKGDSRTALESVPAVARSTNVTSLKNAESEAERKMAEAAKRYGPDHPRLISADADLRAARENTKRAVDSVVATITREYEIAKSTEQTMITSLDKSKTEIRDIGRKEFQLATLERDVQANRQLYDMFVSRSKETNITSDLQSAIARVIDPAIIPGGPVKPQKARIIQIWLGLGLLLGIALALMIERLDNAVRSTEDVAIKLEAPLLGILQWVRSVKGKFGLQRAFIDDIDPGFSESVRTLRTGLLMSALDHPHKVVLITSAVPSEGKTSVAMNLAFALAQVKRTCLVDADMRRPSVYKVLGGDVKMPGLSNLVAGTEPPEKCIYQHESGLFYVPSGPIPPNPLELLSSKRFADALAKLGEMFDVVLIDSAPVQLVSDAVILSGLANALIFVVRADTTPYQVSKGALEMLKPGKAQLIGVVLNRLDIVKSERYYGYGKYFTYGGKYNQYKRAGYYGAKKK